MRTSGAEWYVSFCFSKLLCFVLEGIIAKTLVSVTSSLRAQVYWFLLLFVLFRILYIFRKLLDFEWAMDMVKACKTFKGLCNTQIIGKKKTVSRGLIWWHFSPSYLFCPHTRFALFFWHNECFVGFVCLFWRGGRIRHITCGYNDIAPSEMYAFTRKFSFHCFKNSLRFYFTDVAVLHSADIRSWAKI